MESGIKEKAVVMGDEGRRGDPPVKKISAGGIKVDVWVNSSPQGGSFKTVSFKRVYLHADGSWKDSSNLRTNDIPKAIAALQAAYQWIVFNSGDDAAGNGSSREPATMSETVAPSVESAGSNAVTG